MLDSEMLLFQYNGNIIQYNGNNISSQSHTSEFPIAWKLGGILIEILKHGLMLWQSTGSFNTSISNCLFVNQRIFRVQKSDKNHTSNQHHNVQNHHQLQRRFVSILLRTWSQIQHGVQHQVPGGYRTDLGQESGHWKMLCVITRLFSACHASRLSGNFCCHITPKVWQQNTTHSTSLHYYVDDIQIETPCIRDELNAMNTTTFTNLNKEIIQKPKRL